MYFCSKHRLWYSLEPPRWGGSNEYSQSMFLNINNSSNVYLFKPQFYYIKVGFKGYRLYTHVFVMPSYATESNLTGILVHYRIMFLHEIGANSSFYCFITLGNHFEEISINAGVKISINSTNLLYCIKSKILSTMSLAFLLIIFFKASQRNDMKANVAGNQQ